MATPKPQRKAPAFRSAFRLNQEVQDALETGMRRDGAGRYEKSSWIRRAIRQLYRDDPIFSKVGQGDEGQSFPLQSFITLDEPTLEIIDLAYRFLRTHDPKAPGVQAPLIRAAILHAAKHPFDDEAVANDCGGVAL